MLFSCNSEPAGRSNYYGQVSRVCTARRELQSDDRGEQDHEEHARRRIVLGTPNATKSRRRHRLLEPNRCSPALDPGQQHGGAALDPSRCAGARALQSEAARPDHLRIPGRSKCACPPPQGELAEHLGAKANLKRARRGPKTRICVDHEQSARLRPRVPRFAFVSPNGGGAWAGWITLDLSHGDGFDFQARNAGTPVHTCNGLRYYRFAGAVDSCHVHRLGRS